jgi:hypothetical protein
MTTPTLIAGADLIGFEEVRFVCLTIATVLGTLLGVGLRRVLDMVL